MFILIMVINLIKECRFMKNIKKFLLMTLSLTLLSISLAACGEGNDETTRDTATTESTRNDNDNLMEDAGDAVGDVVDGVGDGINDVVDGVGNGINNAVDGVQNGVDEMTDNDNDNNNDNNNKKNNNNNNNRNNN